MKVIEIIGRRFRSITLVARRCPSYIMAGFRAIMESITKLVKAITNPLTGFIAFGGFLTILLMWGHFSEENQIRLVWCFIGTDVAFVVGVLFLPRQMQSSAKQLIDWGLLKLGDDQMKRNYVLGAQSADPSTPTPAEKGQ